MGRYFTQNVPVNESKIEERFYIKNSVSLDKAKLKGRYTLGFKATPVNWENYGFQVQATVIDTSIQSSKKTVARSVMTFEVKD